MLSNSRLGFPLVESRVEPSPAEPSLKWDQEEQNRSRVPLCLLCRRASEELTFYLSVAISALEAQCLGNPITLVPAQIPSSSNGGLRPRCLHFFREMFWVFFFFLFPYIEIGGGCSIQSPISGQNKKIISLFRYLGSYYKPYFNNSHSQQM